MKKITFNAKKVCVLVLSALMVVMAGLFFVSLKSNKVSAEQQSGFYMTEGAQARLATDANDDSGIRFQAELTIDGYQAIVSSAGEGAVVYFGMEIYPADADIVADPTLVHDFTKIVHSSDYATGDTQYVSFPADSTVYKYTASITYNADTLKEELEIKLGTSLTEKDLVVYLNQAYGTELTARAYYEVDGVKTYVSNPQTRSIWGVATDAYLTDETTWDGETFLLNKYFSSIANADDNYNVLPNGKIVNGASFAETDNLYYDSDKIAVENGYISEDVVNGLEYGTSYDSFKVDASGNMGIHNLNRVHNPYQDSALANGILADFDEPEYVDSVFLMNRTGSYSIITGDDLDAEGVGANSGILKFQPESYDGIMVQFKETFKLGDVDKLYFRIRTNKVLEGTQLRIRLYSSDMERMGDIVPVAVDVVDEWKLIILNASQFTNVDQDTSIGGIKFTFIKSGTIYIDDIGVVKGTWIDPAVANSDVLADFNEEEYIFNLESINAGTQRSAYIYTGTQATEVVSPSDTGVAVATLNQYNYFYIRVQNAFKLSDINAIEFDMKYTGALNTFRLGLVDTNGNNILTGNNQTLANLGVTGYTDGDWNTISISADKLIEKLNTEAGYSADTEIAQIMLYNNVAVLEGTSGYGLYIDEIRALFKFEDTALAEDVIADFDEAGYEDLITFRSGSVVGTKHEEDGRDVLEVSLTANNSYIYIPVPSDKQFTINGLEKGLTFKLKTTLGSLANVRLYFWYTDGTSSVGKYFGTDFGVGVDATDYVKITMTKAKLQSAYSGDVDKTIKQIGILTNAISTWYLDEISLSKYFTEDTNLAYGVIADFDEEGYEDLITFRDGSVVGTKHEEDGRDVLEVSLTANNSYIYIPIQANKQFTISELNRGMTFKLKTTYGSLSMVRMYLHYEDGTSSSGIYFGTGLGVGVDATDYVTFTITKEKLTANYATDEKITQIDILLYSGDGKTSSTWWLDEISISKNFTDSSLADGVVADFDEGGYIEIVESRNGTTINGIVQDGDRSVLKASSSAANHYIDLLLSTDLQFAIADLTEGITFVLRTEGATDIAATKLYLTNTDGANVAFATSSNTFALLTGQTTIGTSEYVTVTLTAELLRQYFTDTTSTVAKISIYPGFDTATTWYIDQISVK